MYEEFKYAYEEAAHITSLTVTKENIVGLHKDISKKLKELGCVDLKSKYSIICNMERKTFTDPKKIDLSKFRSPIDGMIIELCIEGSMEIEIWMTVKEKGSEISDQRSHYRIKADNEDLVLLIGEVIKSFLAKTKNYHFIFHRYAVYVSVPLTVSILYLANKFIKIPEYLWYFIIAVAPFYVFTRFFRWLFPFVYFQEENRNKNSLKIAFSTIVLGVIGSAIYDLIKSLISK